MRTVLAVASLVLGMSAYVASPAAADEKAGQEAVGSVAHIQDLNLTEEQEAKIAEIRKDFKPKVQEASKELAAVVKEEVEKVQGVLTEQQKTKLATDKEERRERRVERLAERLAHLQELDLTAGETAKIAELRKEYHPKIAKVLEGLKGILTDDQKKTREEGLKADKTRREVIASLNLTNEQKEKLEAAGKEIRSLIHEELEKMRDLLTEGQKEKLQEFKDERRENVRDRMAHRIANHKDLDLTEEQKTQIGDIRKEFRPKVQEAGNNLRATVREELEQIVAVLKA
jgi:Spy/CpxP family protein refolding chaperone